MEITNSGGGIDDGRKDACAKEGRSSGKCASGQK